MATRIKLRRGEASAWTTANPTLQLGEPGYESDTGKIKIGDGITAWDVLPYAFEPAFSKNTAFNKNYGSSLDTVTEGIHNYQLIHFKSQAFNPADSTGYVIGAGASAPATNFTRKIGFPFEGTVYGIYVSFNQTAGSAEASTVRLYLNSTTGTIVLPTIVNNAVFTHGFSDSFTPITVGQSDTIEVHWSTPAWATNPVNVIIEGYLLFRRS